MAAGVCGMKIIKLIAGVFVTLLAAYIIGGLVIPGNKTFIQETEINASPEIVWKILIDRESYPEWQNKLSKVEIVDDNNWKEHVKDVGIVDFKFVKREELKLLELKYSMGKSYKGEWLGELKPIGDGKMILKTTDKIEISSWTMKILMTMFFDLDEFATSWNKSLKTQAESVGQQTGNKGGDGR